MMSDKTYCVVALCRSAGAVVQAGLLEVFVCWALKVIQSPDKHSMVKSLRVSAALLLPR